MSGPIPFPPSADRPLLRRQLRAARRQLSPRQQRAAARALTGQLRRPGTLGKARHIALYWPMDGEIDPRLLAGRRAVPGRHFYLPVLRAFPALTLRFARWRPGMPLHRNRFGIPEPAGRPTLTAQQLDALLLPLTGFDARGNRLGMGGGFYDRTLAFRRHGGRTPLLVGIAHACQEVVALPAAAWDVPLDLVVTDRGILRPGRRPRPGN